MTTADPFIPPGTPVAPARRSRLLELLDLGGVLRALWSFFANYVLFLDTELFALLRGLAFNLLHGRVTPAFIYKWVRFLSFRDISLGRGAVIKWGARLRGPIEIGEQAIIDEGAVVTGPVKLGRRCHINYQSWVDRYVTFEDVSGCGHRCFLVTFNHDYSDPERRGEGALQFEPIRIRSGSWVSAHVIILPGVTIGRSAVVGAGSVVTKDVPDSTLAVGNPAVVKKVLRQV